MCTSQQSIGQVSELELGRQTFMDDVYGTVTRSVVGRQIEELFTPLYSFEQFSKLDRPRCK